MAKADIQSFQRVSSHFTWRIGSGTRYLQLILTIVMAVSSDIRWPIEINIGFNEPPVDLMALIGRKKKRKKKERKREREN